MKKMYVCVGVLLVSLIIFSCDMGKLTRAKAQKIIQDHYNFPLVEGVPFDESTLYRKKNDLQKYGLVEIQNYTTQSWSGRRYPKTKVVVTDKGKSYRSGNKTDMWGVRRAILATNLVEVHEITGIRFDEEDKTATVEFTLRKYSYTPWGKVLNNKYDDEYLIPSSARFKKYDDGWRMTAPSKIGFGKPEDFSKIPEFRKKLNLSSSVTPKMEFIAKKKGDKLLLYLSVMEQEYEITDWGDETAMQETNSHFSIENDLDADDDCKIKASHGQAAWSTEYCVKFEDSKVVVYENMWGKYIDPESEIILSLD